MTIHWIDCDKMIISINYTIKRTSTELAIIIICLTHYAFYKFKDQFTKKVSIKIIKIQNGIILQL